MEKLIDFECYSVRKALKVLLQDKSTKRNIISIMHISKYIYKIYRCIKIGYMGGLC